MELIGVPRSNMGSENTVHLTPEQEKLGNIHADTIRTGEVGDKMVLNATLAINQDLVSVISARISGRIQHLYFKNTGEHLRKGDKIFDLYSEELNNAKQEYISAWEQKENLGNTLINYDQILESAKHKLSLWGMSIGAIDELAKSKKSSPYTSFYSDANGTITLISKREGDYLMDGEMVFQVAGLSTLWAEAQVYTSQLASLDRGGEAMVQIPGLENLTLHGKIDFVNPEINPDTRINLVRIALPNDKNNLQPGMPAEVHLRTLERTALSYLMKPLQDQFSRAFKEQ